MREILFRGKTDEGEWVQGDLNHYHSGSGVFIAKREKGRFCHRVIPETIGQYTGLTDKNGAKIFEGDIIKHNRTLWGEDNSDIGVILWCENTCKLYRTSKFDTMDKVEIWKDTAIHYEVIGNIHDNPELLNRRADT